VGIHSRGQDLKRNEEKSSNISQHPITLHGYPLESVFQSFILNSYLCLLCAAAAAFDDAKWPGSRDEYQLAGPHAFGGARSRPPLEDEGRLKLSTR
jgi:hypothetical protein